MLSTDNQVWIGAEVPRRAAWGPGPKDPMSADIRDAGKGFTAKPRFETRAGIPLWITYHNTSRPHTALGGRPRAEAHQGPPGIRMAA